MPEIDVDLTPDEYGRLKRVADALNKTVDQLVADELRERYALASTNGEVVPLRRAAARGRNGTGEG